MASGPTYTFRRGEPVIIGRRVLSGDPTGYTVFADAKPARSAGIVPGDEVLPVASFAVQFVAASGGQAAHWLLTIAGDLEPGLYCTDARFELAGDPVFVTQPCWILVQESVTG